jgi:4-hydroxybenzoate decarboxylase subunit C
VLTHVLERATFETDLYIFSNLSMDTLDYAGPKVNEGSKGVLLGMGEPIRDLQHSLPAEMPHFIKKARQYCPGCMVVEIDSFAHAPSAAQLIVEAPVFADWPLVVLSDDCTRATSSDMNFLWTTFTRFNPGSDIYSRKEIRGNHVMHQMPIVIDARMKPWYPDELECDPETEKLVNSRWREYFPGTRAF